MVSLLTGSIQMAKTRRSGAAGAISGFILEMGGMMQCRWLSNIIITIIIVYEVVHNNGFCG
jgi:hypothetical protein